MSNPDRGRLALNEAAKLSNYDIVIITGNEPKLFPSLNNVYIRKILKIPALIISHIDSGQKIRKNRHRDAIIVSGFSTEFLIFTYIFSLLWTKSVYLVNHHNIQQAYRNTLMRAILKMYHYLNYKFIVNETSSILKDVGYSEQEINQHISLLHPLSQLDSSNLFNTEEFRQKKIGLVGQFRPEKNFSKTLDSLLKLQKSLDFLLIIGTDDFSSFSEINLNGAKLLNTSNEEDYLAILASCDIIVLNYEKFKYFYRCSGVAADAISAKTYVVCPNFPLMSSQVNYPTQVGVLYDNESELEMALKQALELVTGSNKEAFESHYVERSAEKMASTLDQAIQARIVLNR